MENFTFPKKKLSEKDEARYHAAFFKDSWIWGYPKGLSDHPEEFRQFLDATPGIQYIEATGIIRIDEISEEDALVFLGFLRNPPNVLRKPG